MPKIPKIIILTLASTISFIFTLILASAYVLSADKKKDDFWLPMEDRVKYGMCPDFCVKELTPGIM